ncbi:calcium uptake protein 3, mitochondrial isoform X2 [Atheta coriaria]|uniref:calcium uptake protein 3, mitochondrial isoform X2 n=1 Tax=Dalotia coriaria TaxID=877792 RepID=UPI0031F3BC4B
MATINRLLRGMQTITINCNRQSRLFSNSSNEFRGFKGFKYSRNVTPIQVLSAVGGTLAIYTLYECRKNQGVEAAAQAKVEPKVVKLTMRERRFIRFASVEYHAQIYMTPQDFLESVIEADPRPRLKRRMLTDEDIEAVKSKTPGLKEGSSRFFRNLSDKGIISYTEYLFLLSVLTKPQSGFRIAFNMFDTDGNEKVDKNEFLVMEKIFSHAWKGKRGMQMAEGLDMKLPIQEAYVDDEEGLQRRHTVDTTLLVHFFGPKGNNQLNFENFRQFMLSLQKEVLELEFNEFSKGLPTISEVDFAKILLRYTYLDTDDYDNYIDRLLDRIKDTRGITFEEFHVFCQFLNNLDDFNIAMRMYTLADHPISKDEFRRAVKICTGTNLSIHLVNTVFSIFDEDGDGLLSYREFIAIMKDRLHRGAKANIKYEGWDAFKSCIKTEMKTPR